MFNFLKINQMKIKIITNAVYILLFACVVAGCNNFDDPDSYDRNATITDIHVELSSLTLTAGATQTITFWPLPAYADPMKLEWTSSNPSIVTIDRWGRLATHSAGTATLTVSSGTVSKAVNVTVLPDPSDLASFVVGNYIGSAQLSGFIDRNISGVSATLGRVGSGQTTVNLAVVANVPDLGGALTISGDQKLEESSGAYKLSGEATLLGMGNKFIVNGTVRGNTFELELVAENFLSISLTAVKQ